MATASENTTMATRQNTRACLDNMPVELLNLVLCSLRSPLELNSIIHASSVCYRVFRRSRTVILSQVIRNAFGDALPDALGALYALDAMDTWGVFPETGYIDIDTFLERYHSGVLDFPGDFENLAHLSQIWLRTDSFVSDYSNRALLSMHGEKPPRLPVWAHPADSKLRDKVPVSATESTRLQRAFLRFDIFCICFPEDHAVRIMWYELLQRRKRNRLFFGSLYLWEIEELCCVHQYLTHLVTLLIEDLEDDFYRDVMRAADKGKLRQSERINEPAFAFSMINRKEMVNLHEDGLNIFSEARKSRFESGISSVCSEGIRLVRDLLCSDEDTRCLRIIRAFQPSHTSFRNMLGGVETTAKLRTVTNDSIYRHTYNIGWFQSQEDMHRFWSRVGLRLSWRDSGFVFWDMSRVSDMKWEDRAYTYKERKTVEERLRGVYIDERLYKDIVQDYGGFFQYGYDERWEKPW
ncbi:hypothetical protein F5Y06DRAFT_45441 [Hypoxylon sp. FL0890]|nr:hypothetical protein F5Y06DRAFT_45441 [Hypoxylon sp. FL0890]